MISQTQIQIASKLGEIILQTRLQVKKPLFAHFRDFLAPYKSPKPSPHIASITISEFLKQLLPKDLYSLRPKIMSKHHIDKSSHSIQLQINFTLIERKTGCKIQAQSWSVQIVRLGEMGKQCLPLLVQFFIEAILLLNKLPLCSIYQKQKEIRARYMLDYKILFEKTHNQSIVEIKAKDYIFRQNHAVKIKAQIAYAPSLQFDREDAEGIQAWKQRKESIATSDYDGDRKVSVYTFYDADLDCHFLSSDEQSLIKKGITSSVEIKVQMESQECSQQFVLLYADQDEDFFNENRELLDHLAKTEKQYLQK